MFEVVSEGRYSLMRIIDNPFFAFVVYVISSVLLGCILHFIVKYIKKYVFPAYNELSAGLDSLRGDCSGKIPAGGLCTLPYTPD